MNHKVYWPDGYYELRLCDNHAKQVTISPLEEIRDTTYCEMCRYNDNLAQPRMSVDNYIKCWSAIRSMAVSYYGHNWTDDRSDGKGCFFIRKHSVCDTAMWIREHKTYYMVHITGKRKKVMKHGEAIS